MLLTPVAQGQGRRGLALHGEAAAHSSQSITGCAIHSECGWYRIGAAIQRGVEAHAAVTSASGNRAVITQIRYAHGRSGLGRTAIPELRDGLPVCERPRQSPV